MASTPESIDEKSRGVGNRGLPPKDRTIDARQAADMEAARLKALAPGTYRHPDGSPPERKDFEAFSRQYEQMTNERHVWRFARPDGSTYETSWKGLGTWTTARASAGLLGHRVIGEVIPGPTVEGTAVRDPVGRQREPGFTPPPLVQAEPPYSPPPLLQAEPPLTPPPLVQVPPRPSTHIKDEERGIKPDTRALNRGAGKDSVSGSAPRMNKKPAPQPDKEDEIAKQVRKYRDIGNPPKQAAEKLKPVHNVTTEHQIKVRDVVNWAIQTAGREAKPGTGANAILGTAQDKIARLRESNISDAGDNLIYRDADHYLAARTQEFKVRAAMMLYKARNEVIPGSMTLEQAMKIATAPWSSEANKDWAVGPWGANQLYENWKLQQYAQEAHGGPVAERGSAAGGTEWELLGMIDFERYDRKDPNTAPHLLVDLPEKGARFANSPQVPAYLREEAKRIVDKMEKDAKFTK